jgi:5S rRNA maturation endonuclease (ribonuclease M5)
MRGKIVYPILSEEGEILTWFGRDPQYEEKHRKWVESGKTGKEPAKFHFVKNFHRGLELFGQHRLREDSVREQISQLGLIVVEGPNDVIALDALGVPAIGLCSNTITREQTAKVARVANEVADGTVTLMLDCDAEGENGGRQAIWEIGQYCRVRLAWALEMYGGKFRRRQPESLTADEWNEIRGTFQQRG